MNVAPHLFHLKCALKYSWFIFKIVIIMKVADNTETLYCKEGYNLFQLQPYSKSKGIKNSLNAVKNAQLA